MLNDHCVLSVEQPVDALTTPQQPNVDSRVERGGDSYQGVNRDSVGPTSFDSIDNRTRSLRQLGQPGLRQPATQA